MKCQVFDDFAVLSVPFIGQAAEWTLGQIHLIQESVVYSFSRDLTSIIAKSIHKVIALLIRIFFLYV